MGKPGKRLRVVYELAVATGEDPRDRARGIALEQTVELAAGAFPAELERRVVGRVEEVGSPAGGIARAVVSYPPRIVGGELPQLLNLLFGNVSLQAGIRVVEIGWPASLLAAFPGPRHGISGLRALCGAEPGRPLVCCSLKPLGLSAKELAERCRELALAGVDLVKDDHSLADQRSAPFEERLARCQEAVEEANAETGGRTLYLPNVGGRTSDLVGKVVSVRRAGCRGVLLLPLAQGLDAVRWLAESTELAIVAHPALAGAFFAADHGIAAPVLLGQIFRMAGCDAVVYPNAGGRFGLSAATCEALVGRLREPLGKLRPAFPVAGGGMDAERVTEWVGRCGSDMVFLFGSLYREADLRRAAARLVDAVRGAGAVESGEERA